MAQTMLDPKAITANAVLLEVMVSDAEFPTANAVNVHGELFTVEHENGTVYLTHPQWSLVGMGPSVDAAQQDLVSEARELAQSMRRHPRRPLSAQARRMFQYVSGIR